MNDTSRAACLGTFSTTNVSEALLLIDEPGAGQHRSGSGPAAAADPLQRAERLARARVACVMTVAPGAAVSAGLAAESRSERVPGNGQCQPGDLQRYSDSGPPVTAGLARVFRITNVRANVARFSAAAVFAGTTPVLASISISGSTSLPINNPVQIAGFIQAGLSTALRPGNGSSAARSSAPSLAVRRRDRTSQLGLLTSPENFGTAFKTRVSAPAPGADETRPDRTSHDSEHSGQIYNSESGFIRSLSTGTAGLGRLWNPPEGRLQQRPEPASASSSPPRTSRINVSPRTPTAPAATVTTTQLRAVSPRARPRPDSFNSAPVSPAPLPSAAQ